MCYITAMNTEYLSTIIGQTALKQRLEIYSGSFAKTGRLPFLLLKAARGSGKTKVVREFKKTLVRPNGGAVPLLEVNAATVKNCEQFFEQVYPVWKNNGAVLFFDEAHNLPVKLQEIFLTVLEKDPNPVREVTYNHREIGDVTYEFDFTKMSVVFATTDHQKMLAPLLDRFTEISLAPYSEDELFTIFKKNAKTMIGNDMKQDFISVFRGHPRACVELAEQLDHFAAARNIRSIDRKSFTEFCSVMGIHDLGLNDGEMMIIKILAQDGACSLNSLAAKTGFSRSAIQKDYEYGLLKKGLIDIDLKRRLTKKGHEFFLKNS